MSAFYRAGFEKQATGSVLQWNNCAAASGAMLADQATLRLKNPTPDAIRRLTGDTSGGLTMGQIGTALAKYGIHTTVYNANDRYHWPEMLADLTRGRFMVVSGDYDVLPFALRGDKDYRGTHAVFFHAVTATTVTVGDPLNDGRRPGIPNGYITWPLTVARAYVEKFASQVPGDSLHACAMDLRKLLARTGLTANVRAGSTRDSALLGSIRDKQSLVYGGVVIGESIGGEARWYRVWYPPANRLAYVHASVVKVVS